MPSKEFWRKENSQGIGIVHEALALAPRKDATVQCAQTVSAFIGCKGTQVLHVEEISSFDYDLYIVTLFDESIT